MSGAGTIIQVKVKPNARESVLEQAVDGTWTARLKSQPIDGKANEELVALVARHFGCHRREVRIKSGGSARVKLLSIGLP